MRARGLAPVVTSGGQTREAGARAVPAVLGHPGITAVVAYNDQCAVGVMDRLHRTGIRVSRDVSVTGSDDDGVAQISLTTINPSQLVQARLAVETAIERAEGRRSGRVVHVVPAPLAIRGSTAPPAVPNCPKLF